MNKGFTMIELLAVIVLLAAIALIITPLVTNSVKKGGETIDKQTQNNIVMAAKNWASDNKDKLPTAKGVKVQTLIDDGYLDTDIDEGLKGSCVLISKQEQAYYYKYSTACNDVQY